MNRNESKSVRKKKLQSMVSRFDGLFFYFEDIEGNILETAYNVFIPLD
ncbi:hypothetical protein [Filimonas effusa]|nr:hypothetical protein [Filimonas effusa]